MDSDQLEQRRTRRPSTARGGDAVDGVRQAIQMFAEAVSAGVRDDGEVHAAAAQGVAGTGGPLPHLDAIQRSFGHHDVSAIGAHVGGQADVASRAMGARAYASGDRVAFAAEPDLHLSAHEAAHVVQQRGGVQLSGGVGQAGDAYEQHADAVADLVARGESAEALLDQMAPHASPRDSAVQRDATAPATSRMASQAAVASAIRQLSLLEDIDGVIAALEALPATGPVELEVGRARFGIQGAWAEPLRQVAITVRTHLAGDVAPDEQTAEDVGREVAAIDTTPIGAAAGVTPAMGIDGSMRLRFVRDVGTFDFSVTEPLRLGSGSRSRVGVRATDAHRRGATSLDATSQLSGSEALPGARYAGSPAIELGLLRIDHAAISPRASGSVASAEEATTGIVFQIELGLSYDGEPIECRLNGGLLNFSVRDGALSFAPFVEGTGQFPSGLQFGVRYTPDLAYVARRLPAGLLRLRPLATAVPLGSEATVSAAGEGIATDIAAEGGAVAASETGAASLTAVGVSSFVGALLIGDMIYQALVAVHASVLEEDHQFRSAIRAGRAMGETMQSMLRDLCAAYVAVMRGDPASGTTGGQVGAREAHRRIGELMSTTPLQSIHANARRTHDLYAQIYAVAAPQFTTQAHRLALDIAANAPHEWRSAMVDFAFQPMQQAIMAAAVQTTTPPLE